jgi:hypothetical protein
MTQLIAKDGSLYLNDSILVVRYPEGDCDTINWPFKDKDAENLESALFDEREMGNVPSVTQSVLLPNGTTFTF